MRIAIQQPALPVYRVPLFRAMTRAMPEHEITLYYGSEEPELKNADSDGFEAVLSPFKRWQLPVVGEIRWHSIQWKLVDGKAADVVVLSWNIRAVSFWLALVRARINKVPAIIWGHGYSKSNSTFVANWIRSLPVKLSSATIFYDAATAAGYGDKALKNKLHVAHKGLDSEAIQSERNCALQTFPQQSDARDYLELDEGPILIYIGRLMQANRLDLIIVAMTTIILEHPNIKLVIVGEGEQQKKALVDLISACKLSEHIVWTGSLYTEYEIAPWMLAADIFVYPCNVGLSLIHAFNYGVPAVICAPLSQHNPEVAIVEDRVNTMVASEQSPTALTCVLLELLNAPAMTSKMGDSALRSVLETHNVDSMVNTFEQVFDELCEEIDS